MSDKKTEERKVEVSATEESSPRKKIDVRSALALIPPASQLFGKEKTPRERRVRLRYHDEVKEGIAKMNPQLVSELGGGEYVEIVVAHRHKFKCKVEIDENVPPNEIWVNSSNLPEHGVSDNSIVTVRVTK